MRYLVLLPVVLLSTLPSTEVYAQEVTAEQRLAVRAEVGTFMDQYYAIWAQGDVDQLAEQIWVEGGQLGNFGVAPIAPYAEAIAEVFPPLRERGYDHSGMPDRHICLLAPDVAIVSGHGFRYRADGSVLDEQGWTYLLVRSDTGWRMGGSFQHAPNTAVTC